MIDKESEDLRFDLERDVYTVSRLNREVRTVLEGSFPLLWVEGELSNLSQPPSGHIYFSLKDEYAQVRCAMFRTRRVHLRFRPENGVHVLARVRVSLYEGRGDFQLVVEHLEPAGEGALRFAFERLKQKLASEGLFDAARKRPIPEFPRQVGLITSAAGAAVRDLLSVLARRYPALPVLIFPVPVQGGEAAEAMVAALRRANARAECDVLILARGGGSMEDLWPFNDETLARAIASSAIPVVTGIGHEIDFTIADFVADQRAATPSAAAELVSPDGVGLLRRVDGLRMRLVGAQQQALATLGARCRALERHLRMLHPVTQVRQRQQWIDHLHSRLLWLASGRLQAARLKLRDLSVRAETADPRRRLPLFRRQLADLERRMRVLLPLSIGRRRERLERLARTLDAVSPLGTLARGYAIVRRLPEGAILRSAAQVDAGDQLEARLHRGRLMCRVEEAHPAEEDPPG